jgi:hypothetical protein
MVRISKLALSITLLLSVPCWGMENRSPDKQEEKFSSKIYRMWEETAREIKAENLSPEDRKTFESRMNVKLTEMFTNSEKQPDKPKDIKIITNKKEFTKVPTPKHVTLLSKDSPQEKVAAFKAMMNVTPLIYVVNNLDAIKNPDIKKIREMGNYTVFADSDYKWVIDNRTGHDMLFSQELIERLIPLDTEALEAMIDNGVFEV